jgi:crotonobetainyl-CoA:carnitine CoA-transferase CaiB-like acyl-CoA transferase
MGRWCAVRSNAEVVETLGKASIPCAPVLSPQEALDDPHVRRMGFLQPIEYPGVPKPAPLAKVPVWLSATPGSIRHRPPTLGEHTDVILTELGYSEREIADLRNKSVV